MICLTNCRKVAVEVFVVKEKTMRGTRKKGKEGERKGESEEREGEQGGRERRTKKE